MMVKWVKSLIRIISNISIMAVFLLLFLKQLDCFHLLCLFVFLFSCFFVCLSARLLAAVLSAAPPFYLCLRNTLMKVISAALAASIPALASFSFVVFSMF
jgi:hypothetical protein